MPYYPTIVEEFGGFNQVGSANTLQFNNNTVSGDNVNWGSIPNAVTYAISGTDASDFLINTSTGVVTWNINPDIDKTYVFVIEGTDIEDNTVYQSVILSTYSYNIGQIDGIYVFHEIGEETTPLSFPEEYIDPLLPPVNPPNTYSAHSATLKDYVGGIYRVQYRLPNQFTNTPTEFMNVDTFVTQDFGISGYTEYQDRNIEYGIDLTESDAIGFKNWLDIRLDTIGIDIDGRPDWYSQINSYYTSQNSNNSSVSPQFLGAHKSETITVTFNEFSPNILETSPYIDEALIVQLIKKDGNGNIISITTCDKNNLSNISVSAIYPETITIHVEGNYTRLLFPNEVWEYYFDKQSDYTIIPEHESVTYETTFTRPYDDLSLTVNDLENPLSVDTYDSLIATSSDIRILPQDPNEVFDGYKISQTFSNQPRINGIVYDLSQEIPTIADILSFDQDEITNRDVTYTFTVTSSIPSWNSSEWVAGSYAVGDYVTSGGNLYRVIVGGLATIETGPPSGTGNYQGTAGNPPVLSGPVYRYIPDIGLSFGAATLQIQYNIVNNYIVGLERYEEILNTRTPRREPKPNTLPEPSRTDGF